MIFVIVNVFFEFVIFNNVENFLFLFIEFIIDLIVFGWLFVGLKFDFILKFIVLFFFLNISF